ncbi:hypothetical protein T06_1470 [Trichinella sp. T6]|nr:hypothetical protein T06_1470 [Trichinella sp. T6]
MIGFGNYLIRSAKFENIAKLPICPMKDQCSANSAYDKANMYLKKMLQIVSRLLQNKKNYK